MHGLEVKKFDEKFVSEIIRDLDLVKQMLPDMIKQEQGASKILLQEVEKEFNAIFTLLGENEIQHG